MCTKVFDTFLATICFGCVIFSETSTAAADEPYTLPNTEIVPLTAEANGVDYRLYIYTPPDYETSGKRYPVMVTLDADYQFAIAVNHANHLAYRGQVPEMIIVSIAYDRVARSAEEYRMV